MTGVILLKSMGLTLPGVFVGQPLAGEDRGQQRQVQRHDQSNHCRGDRGQCRQSGYGGDLAQPQAREKQHLGNGAFYNPPVPAQVGRVLDSAVDNPDLDAPVVQVTLAPRERRRPLSWVASPGEAGGLHTLGFVSSKGSKSRRSWVLAAEARTCNGRPLRSVNSLPL